MALISLRNAKLVRFDKSRTHWLIDGIKIPLLYRNERRDGPDAGLLDSRESRAENDNDVL
jgi:hypothetical protein